MLRDRQTADSSAAPDDKPARVNLLNWDGKGRPEGLFPPKPDGGRRHDDGRPWRPVAARAASLLLRYPDDDVLAALPTLRAALDELPRDGGRAAAAGRRRTARGADARPRWPPSTSSCSTSAAAAACT